MTVSIDLSWLPEIDGWPELLAEAVTGEPPSAWQRLLRLSNSRMDFVRAAKLDRSLQRYCRQHGPPPAMPQLRFAFLGSSTIGHLLPAIRLGAFRRGIWLETFEGDYGLYRQQLTDTSSGLYSFQPAVVCLSLDARHVAGLDGTDPGEAVDNIRDCWRIARTNLGCTVLQQTLIPTIAPILGNQEDRGDSPAALVHHVNHLLRRHAQEDGVYLAAADTWAAMDGLRHWFDAALWNRAKQEVHPRAGNIYGDQIGRILAAMVGRSAKCLVLDLDNTLWGGVIGDDGLDGIVLGQGNAVGEAYLALQSYIQRLAQRGIILAVCSKNEEATALLPFDRHPEMLLRRDDIACFVANWDDKAKNLRHIAAKLNIGLDSLVFLDDNPAERALIRQELPSVAVPELPEDPALYLEMLSEAGYFETLGVTGEDRARTALYAANAERETLRSSVTDIGRFLSALSMKLTWAPFDQAGHARILQLLNKTNQFNLTTRRYTAEEVSQLIEDGAAVTLQFRLTDRYGDNGIIALIIGRANGDSLEIETWLMSCRVLGRQVEDAVLAVLAQCAQAAGFTRLGGIFRPTAKNGMVREHYRRAGFTLEEESADGTTRWALALDRYQPTALPIEIRKADVWTAPISMAS